MVKKGLYVQTEEIAISYIHGRLEAEIEGFARAIGCPVQLLTSRLVELLQPGRPRSSDRMPTLSREATQGNETIQKVEVVSSPRGNKTPDGVKTKASGPAAYWAKMTKKQRSLEMKKRLAVRRASKEAKHGK